MNEERITTLHPEGKQGVKILKRRYDVIKDFILQTLRHEKRMTFKALTKLAKEQLDATFDGKVSWYIVTVKLDLEARGLIVRIPGTSPQQLRMAK